MTALQLVSSLGLIWTTRRVNGVASRPDSDSTVKVNSRTVPSGSASVITLLPARTASPGPLSGEERFAPAPMDTSKLSRSTGRGR